jgi:gamma-tubulin complex component 4
MLAEVLLVLTGHPSAFFIPHPPAPARPTTLSLSPSLATYLHPGEIASLNNLGQLAFQYSRIRAWALSIQAQSRSAVHLEYASKKGKERAQPDLGTAPACEGAYFSTLVAGLLCVLKDYELLVVETEARILAVDPALVQDGRNHVPLSTLVATFDPWRPVLADLGRLVDTLSSPSAAGEWTPGALLHHLTSLCATGNPRLRAMHMTLLHGLRALFLTHLVAFLLFGLAAPASTPVSPAVGIDAGPDPQSPQHRVYRLNADLFPPGVRARTRESVLYVGRVAATLRREGRTLPPPLVAGLREETMAVTDLEEDGGLERAVSRARAEVGE